MPSDSELSEGSIMSDTDMMELDAFFQSLTRKSDDVLIAFIRTLVRSISPAQVTPVMSDVLACLRTDTARPAPPRIYAPQTKILEGRTNISECIFEALFKGVSTRFGRHTLEKCFENAL
jgi:hypothetical protein